MYLRGITPRHVCSRSRPLVLPCSGKRLPEDAHEAARALGQLRFEQVIESVANRLKTDRGLVARVMAMVDQSHAHELPADSRQPGEAHAPSTTDAVPGRSTTDPGGG